MSTLLDISADPSVKEELTRKLREFRPDCTLVHSNNVADALTYIEERDVDAIFVDTRIADTLRKDVNELLASTSLTTKIILIDSNDDVMSREPFTILGLESIALPLSEEIIDRVIGH
jgi:DNA-binding NtrC family response regulator